MHAIRLEIEGWALRLDAQLTTRRPVNLLGEHQRGRATRDDPDRFMDGVRDTTRVQQ